MSLTNEPLFTITVCESELILILRQLAGCEAIQSRMADFEFDPKRANARRATAQKAHDLADRLTLFVGEPQQ